jgi:hypothetical protein
MTDIELGWLTGLIDGEGCVTVTRMFLRHPQPLIQITNTDTALMEKAAYLLGELCGKKPAIHPQNMRGKYGYRPVYYLAVRNHAGVSRILTALAPYLIAKKAQAERILEYVTARLATPRKSRRGVKGGQDRPYTAEELELLKTVHSMNSYSHRRELWGFHPNSQEKGEGELQTAR